MGHFSSLKSLAAMLIAPSLGTVPSFFVTNFLTRMTCGIHFATFAKHVFPNCGAPPNSDPDPMRRPTPNKMADLWNSNPTIAKQYVPNRNTIQQCSSEPDPMGRPTPNKTAKQKQIEIRRATLKGTRLYPGGGFRKA
jgi:hypothetical protein